jgi:serine/threonine-protein kinase
MQNIGANTVLQTTVKRPAFHLENRIVFNKILGEGGMGKVLLGHQSFPKRDIAIKVLHHVSKELQFALLHEAMVIGKLEHPNIVPIHEIKYKGPNQSIEVVMKYVQGETLLQYIHSKDFTIKKAVQALVQVCHALEFAHSKDIYHRDVKPENIMLGDFGAIYLLDWGLAIDRSESKPRAQEGLVGTLGYMAPEMLKGCADVVDERTDVYLLGSTLHEVLVQMPRHSGGKKRRHS